MLFSLFLNELQFPFKNHASLQREMEYHADAISTFITNREEQTSSLLRLELSDVAFNHSSTSILKASRNIFPKIFIKIRFL
jgi:hypothetical protein